MAEGSVWILRRTKLVPLPTIKYSGRNSGVSVEWLRCVGWSSCRAWTKTFHELFWFLSNFFFGGGGDLWWWWWRLVSYFESSGLHITAFFLLVFSLLHPLLLILHDVTDLWEGGVTNTDQDQLPLKKHTHTHTIWNKEEANDVYFLGMYDTTKFWWALNPESDGLCHGVTRIWLILGFIPQDWDVNYSCWYEMMSGRLMRIINLTSNKNFGSCLCNLYY